MNTGSDAPDVPDELRRSLGVFDAVVIGLGSMIGAGIFAALAPAARAAGSGLLIGLAIAALVAYCNALSSARLAVRYPASGGTYVYGKHQLGDFWGYLAGWGFVVGKTASCAAMALTVGHYAFPQAGPQHAHAVAVAAVVAVTAVNVVGVQKSAWVTRVIVVVVLAVLGAVVIAVFSSTAVDASHLGVASTVAKVSLAGVLQAAGLLFFAFAGYARIATLGEEVRDPSRVIPRAILLALGIALVVYAVVAVAVLIVLGPQRLSGSPAPLADAVRAAGVPWLVPVVGVGAVVAATGSLLALLLGVSRTTLAMARDRYLPHPLATVHPRFQVPQRAELAVAAVVVVLAATADLRAAIGFSSFAVLVYYAIANASAFTLGRARVVPVIGMLGCAVLAVSLPLGSVLAGAAVFALGAAVYGVQRIRRGRSEPAR